MLQSSYSKIDYEAGCDEAGRGCLAGPVVAAAVILPTDFHHPLLNDSKQLSEKSRRMLRTVIENNAISTAVAFVSTERIDEINILNASIEAMHLSLAQLNPKAAFIIVDGNRFKPFGNTPFKTIIKGDAIFLSIAAASILAKTHRDAYMEELHTKFPEYSWNQNKGYPTADHRKAIIKHGSCVHHRMSFNLLGDAQLKLL